MPPRISAPDRRDILQSWMPGAQRRWLLARGASRSGCRLPPWRVEFCGYSETTECPGVILVLHLPGNAGTQSLSRLSPAVPGKPAAATGHFRGNARSSKYSNKAAMAIKTAGVRCGGSPLGRNFTPFAVIVEVQIPASLPDCQGWMLQLPASPSWWIAQQIRKQLIRHLHLDTIRWIQMHGKLHASRHRSCSPSS